MTKLIVAGSRTFQNFERIKDRLDEYPDEISEVFCGECRGPDLFGKRWAEERGIKVRSFPADWDRYGKKAGFLRNKAMAEEADALLAFWDGRSKGTDMMIRLMQEMGKSVKVIIYSK